MKGHFFSHFPNFKHENTQKKETKKNFWNASKLRIISIQSRSMLFYI